MAAIELPEALSVSADISDALKLHETLRTRFKVEVRN
jgi:hypothetical protein